MKATELLKQQHQEIDELFERVTLAEGDELRAIRAELASILFAHSDVERTIFYPASREAIGAAFQIQTYVDEHGLVDYALFKWLATEPGSEPFHSGATVLKDLFQRHAEEEEDELLKQAEDAMSEERLDDLGDRMEVRFDEVREGDVEAMLADAIRAAISPLPRAQARKTAPRTAAPRKAAKRAAKRQPAKRTAARAQKRGATKARATAGRKKAAAPVTKPARPTTPRKAARPTKQVGRPTTNQRKGGRPRATR